MKTEDIPLEAPCSGLRVIDLTTIVAGPFATQFLADLGAEVIRIEGERSDIVRYITPQNRGISGMFEQNNRGKKSVLLDIKSDTGRQAVFQLASSADIFVENSRPGVMQRLGFGYDALAELNPRLIYVSVNGFGDEGPYVDRPAYDTVVQGLVGFMPVQGGSGRPKAVMSAIADKATGIFASHAILAALLFRERTGVGQKVVVPMLRAYANLALPEEMINHSFPGSDTPAMAMPMGHYEVLATADGGVIGLVLQRSQFERLVTGLGRNDLLEDERFLTNETIGPNAEALYAAIGPQAAAMTTAQFLALADRCEVPFGPVNGIEEFFEDEHARQSGAYFDFEDELLGTVRHLGYPAQFSRSKIQNRRRAPLLGEHNTEILGDPAQAGAPSQS